MTTVSPSHSSWPLAVLLGLLIVVSAGCSTDSDADSGSDPAADAGSADSSVATDGEAAADAAAAYTAPTTWGPHAVGTRRYEWVDAKRKRSVPVRVWYPAEAKGDGKATYIILLKGRAHEGAKPVAGLKSPLVLFSHGFRGAAEQSFGIMEHVASHGYVVAAPDHVTNTLMDFSASDEDAAKVAAQRPADIHYTHKRLVEPGYELASAIDAKRTAVMGHSFGGWTTLVLSGASVSVATANKACAAGSKSNIMCKYTKLLPNDAAIEGLKPIAGLKAAVALTPGGFSSFGDSLGKVSVPVLVVGGEKDSTTTLEAEIDPIYTALAAPKAKLVVAGAGHMSFTDVCTLSIAKSFLKDMCVVPGLIKQDRGTTITATFVTAWLDRWVKATKSAAKVLSPQAAKALFPEASLSNDGGVIF